MAQLRAVAPPAEGVYRLARGFAPFSPPDWAWAEADGTFGNRFDDPTADKHPPEERFRAIYCATQRIATFGETLARFRPEPNLLLALNEIEDDDPINKSLSGALDPEDPDRLLISADWRLRRRICQATLDPQLRFADISNYESLEHLRKVLAPLAGALNLDDIDLSALTSQHRRLTQHCARHIHDLTDTDGEPLFAGLRYVSRLDAGWECWAIFDDRVSEKTLAPGFPYDIPANDSDLLAIADVFGLTIEVITDAGHYLRPPFDALAQ